jgi:Ca2+-binding RTX toxin-like protein
MYEFLNTTMPEGLSYSAAPAGAASIIGPNPTDDPPPSRATVPEPSTGTLVFETVGVAQALGYNAAVNDLNFSNSRSGASALFVNWNADGTVGIFQGIGAGQTVTFGAGIYGEANLIFSDGTRGILGSPGDDLLLGAATNDSLWGGPGNDTLYGGRNPDSLYGGDGADLFIVYESSGTLVDQVRDWQPIDRLSFWGPAGSAANYLEMPLGATEAEALAKITSGVADYVAFQTNLNGLGTTVTILADSAGVDVAGSRIFLRDTDLTKIDFSNIVTMPVLAFPALPPLPTATVATAAPAPFTYFGIERQTGGGGIHGNMDTAHIADSRTGQVDAESSTTFHVNGGVASSLTLSGQGLTYRQDTVAVYDIPTGTISSVGFLTNGFSANLNGVPVAATTVFHWILDDGTQPLFATLLAGSDDLQGGFNFPDLIRGLTGSDTISGSGGDDILWGGAGNDVIYAIARPGRIGDGVPTTGSTYLRGEEGDDDIYGGNGFDDINGNQGNDTAGGGPGDDWVVGGKDSDLLYGDAGGDLVYGNLGSDTCDGGAGNDTIRGGQENDVLRGGDGADFVSGDKGDDTMTGGLGADIFHTFGDAGIDRVTDFSLAEGDRVMLDPGTQFTVIQVGADTVVNMTGGGQMVLVGVTMTTLTPGWIFGA